MSCSGKKYCEPHIGTWTQLVGIHWPVVSKVQGPPPKIAEDRIRQKDMENKVLAYPRKMLY